MPHGSASPLPCAGLINTAREGGKERNALPAVGFLFSPVRIIIEIPAILSDSASVKWKGIQITGRDLQ